MIPTMIPSASSGITGFNPSTGTNEFVDSAVEVVNGNNSDGSVADSSEFSLDPSKDALSQLLELAKSNPEYMETYLQLLAERENTTNAQAWYEKMSNSQYQRAFEDLSKTGFNPYALLMQLGGAGSGSVQSADTWSTSPYANKLTKESNQSQRLTATANLMKALLGSATAILGILALAL